MYFIILEYLLLLPRSKNVYTTRYQFKRGIDLWLRWGNWMYTNRKSIGSGLNEINGPSKTDLRAQIRFQF